LGQTWSSPAIGLNFLITFLTQCLGLSIFDPKLGLNNSIFRVKGGKRFTQKMLGCFNPNLGQIWTNPAIGLNFLIPFLTQRLGLSIFDPKLG